nr:hypothetical protein [Shewanella shenzhenensis]
HYEFVNLIGLINFVIDFVDVIAFWELFKLCIFAKRMVLLFCLVVREMDLYLFALCGCCGMGLH